jgi:hypothetical protein
VHLNNALSIALVGQEQSSPRSTRDRKVRISGDCPPLARRHSQSFANALPELTGMGSLGSVGPCGGSILDHFTAKKRDPKICHHSPLGVGMQKQKNGVK